MQEQTVGLYIREQVSEQLEGHPCGRWTYWPPVGRCSASRSRRVCSGSRGLGGGGGGGGITRGNVTPSKRSQSLQTPADSESSPRPAKGSRHRRLGGHFRRPDRAARGGGARGAALSPNVPPFAIYVTTCRHRRPCFAGYVDTGRRRESRHDVSPRGSLPPRSRQTGDKLALSRQNVPLTT